MARRSQRSIITPEHFIVAPEILGLPLASPTRRAIAMGIDLLLVAILVKAGAVFLALVAAVLLFRISASGRKTGFIKSSVRTLLRVFGAIFLFIVILNAWRIAKRHINHAVDDESDVVSAQLDTNGSGDLNLNFTPRQAASLAGTLLTLRRSDDSTEVAEAAAKLLTVARAGGAGPDELRAARHDLVEMLGDDATPPLVQAVDVAIARVAGDVPRVANPDTMIRQYLSAAARHDSAATQAYRDSLRTALAGKDLDRMQQRAQRNESRADSLDRELANARKAHGIRAFISGIADDVGVGFGWSAVYFTAFLTLMRGQTPGKRVTGVRVILLDGKPLGWWMSFERFGGYAASLSVGLLGFLQILWDRNRQGLHDKACETVVVRVIRDVPAQPLKLSAASRS